MRVIQLLPLLAVGASARPEASLPIQESPLIRFLKHPFGLGIHNPANVDVQKRQPYSGRNDPLYLQTLNRSEWIYTNIRISQLPINDGHELTSCSFPLSKAVLEKELYRRKSPPWWSLWNILSAWVTKIPSKSISRNLSENISKNP